MTRISLFRFSLLVFCSIVLLTLTSRAGGQKYFPEVGKEAVHQRAVDLHGGAVVLSIALQPGYEDLTLLSHLRLGLGARPVVAYLTNGETTPSDLNGMPPSFVAGERQEEAYQATSLLGSQSHFLNFPDPGVLTRKELLADVWKSDSLRRKLISVIRSYAPDVIVIHGDFRGETVQSLRQQYLVEAVIRAAEVAAVKGGEDSEKGAEPWTVHRIFVESQPDPAHRNAEYDRMHPFWKASYRSIADEAREEYKTLRFQLPAWVARGERRYEQVWPEKARQARSLISGMPVITRKIRPLARLVEKAAGRETGGVRSTTLSTVSYAIDSLNLFLAYQRPSLSSADFRPVAVWKNTLEDLRCSLLEVKVAYTVDDTLVSQGQLVSLNFKGFSSKTSSANTQIYFPGVMEKKWGLNEASKYQFPFTAPVEYRVITPRPMEFTYPGSQFGIRSPFLRNRFSFLIFHQDSLRGRDFVYRGEVLFRSGPRRTFEVLTPAARAVDGAPVVVRLQNLSRDAYQGTLTLSDSVINTVRKDVLLSRDNEMIIDTLALSLRQPFPPGVSRGLVSLSGLSGSLPVMLRNFDAAVDTSVRLTLVSRAENSPLADALRRLGLPFTRVADVRVERSQRPDLLIIDRDALTTMSVETEDAEALQQWVKEGGHLVVFPQSRIGKQPLPTDPWGRFTEGPLVEPTDSLLVSSDDSLFIAPNEIREEDWQGWVVSRSQKSLLVQGSTGADVIVRAPRTRNPVLVTAANGKGAVTFVALDLLSQLVNIHPGAHRLLANLLARR